MPGNRQAIPTMAIGALDFPAGLPALLGVLAPCTPLVPLPRVAIATGIAIEALKIVTRFSNSVSGCPSVVYNEPLLNEVTSNTQSTLHSALLFDSYDISQMKHTMPLECA